MPNLERFLDLFHSRDGGKYRGDDVLTQAVVEAFSEATAAPPQQPVITVQRVDEQRRNGSTRTTYEVVDRRLAKSERIVAEFGTLSEARAAAAVRAPIGGGAYVLEAVDTDEYFHDTDYEILGNVHTYGVISGCTLTYDSGDLTVDLAAGVELFNGSPVTVAAAANGYTLVADGSNERWAALCGSSTGTPVLVSGDAAASSSVEPTKPEIGDRVLFGMAKIQAAQTVANNCEYKLDKRVITHAALPSFKYKTATQVFTTSTTFADVTASSGNFAFSIGVGEVWRAEYFIPLSMAGTGGAKFQLTGPAAPTSVRIQSWPTLAFRTAAADVVGVVRPDGVINGFSTSFGNRNSSSGGATDNTYFQGEPNGLYASAFIINGVNAGTVTLQAAQNSADSTTTLGIGAWMRAERVA